MLFRSGTVPAGLEFHPDRGIFRINCKETVMLTMAEERDVTQSVKALRRLWFIQIVGSGIVEGAVLYSYSDNPAKLSEDTILLV